MSLNRKNAFYSCFTVFFYAHVIKKGASKVFLRLLRVLQSFFGVKGYFLVFYSKKKHEKQNMRLTRILQSFSMPKPTK